MFGAWLPSTGAPTFFVWYDSDWMSPSVNDPRLNGFADGTM
ncbi:hypothetical protein C499_07410 [Halogeometricum borinquense DSM 11551]|uniref:Uncharacterized protein n=1 Tax=Halogeometricum borinquense (strain ATCC 700274 / DSM 11551 / JCM 10706 / KCTC 4070 / PR3) TaxID=469382 RepID=E4NLQ2_HALBP|nr:hypothetical protein Hbor_16870 [Halogeometricum borinquense DSM 11551]ELY28471.1 hypothetical protein C499_07410 [Halogeometricum borinquense DSM 11551]